MPRNITVTFDDGTTHVYQNAPDDITPEAVSERAQKEFSKSIVSLDGGKKPTQEAAAPIEEPKSYLQQAGQNIGDEVAGVVRGAGSIGNTILTANEKINEYAPAIGAAIPGSKLLSMASNAAVPESQDQTISGLVSGKKPLTNYEQRAQGMDQGLQAMGARPESGFFKGGKIFGEVAGTGGVGEAIAPVAALSKVTAPLSESIASSGVNATGSTIGSLFKRAAGGAVTGGAATGLIDPDSAGTGAVVGAAIPTTIAAAAKGLRIAGSPVNPMMDATLKASTDAGYVVPPSSMNSGIIPKTLEGISGKAKTEQAALLKNQPVTDALARKAIGLEEGVPITPEATQSVIKNAVKTGYDPVKNAGKISSDQQFSDDLKGLYDKYQGAAASFPGAVKDDIKNALDGYNVAEFDAGDAIKAIKSLRDDANSNFIKGDADVANTQKGIAKALEDQVERDLAARGDDGAKMLQDFRDARKLIAKAYTVQDAIKEGSGSINAAKLAARVQSGKPMSGELKTIGDFANNYSKIARLPQGGDANPFTVLDAVSAPFTAFTLPAARVASRSIILSPSVQKAMANKQSVSSLASSGVAEATAKTAPAITAEKSKKKAK